MMSSSTRPRHLVLWAMNCAPALARSVVDLLRHYVLYPIDSYDMTLVIGVHVHASVLNPKA